MSNPPKIVRVNDPASAFTLVAIAASILLLYSLSRIISLQRRVRDLESRPPVDDIVMRGMIRQQINDTFQTYERRRAAELEAKKEVPVPKEKEIKDLPKEPKEQPKESKDLPKESPKEPKELPKETKEPEPKAEPKEEPKPEIVAKVEEKIEEYIADNEEEAKIATKTIRKRSTKPKAAV
jgi:outer membrane biosynthesis protein TonB